MEYVYAALLIHEAGGKIDEATVKKVVEAAGGKVQDARVKALIASLEGVNIKEAIAKASVVQATSAPAPVAEKKEDKKKAVEEEKKSEEAAAAGLGALFG